MGIVAHLAYQHFGGIGVITGRIGVIRAVAPNQGQGKKTVRLAIKSKNYLDYGSIIDLTRYQPSKSIR